MRGLLALVIGMGVLIVAGVATIGVTVVHRATRAAAPDLAALDAVLDEPAGTRIVGAAGFGEALAVTLQGGGPDRVIVLDRSGHRTGQIRLADPPRR